MQDQVQTNSDVTTIHLHKENINITKNTQTTATVNVYKNVFTKEEVLTVPITYEELVIEVTDTSDGTLETTRIPLTEEQVEINKHTVKLADVEIYKEKVKEVIQLHETLQEEKLKIKTVGDAEVKIQQNPIH